MVLGFSGVRGRDMCCIHVLSLSLFSRETLLFEQIPLGDVTIDRYELSGKVKPDVNGINLTQTWSVCHICRSVDPPNPNVGEYAILGVSGL